MQPANKIVVYAERRTSRLDYIISFFAEQFPENQWEIETDNAAYRNHDGPKVNYSHQSIDENEVHISPIKILFESGITTQDSNTGSFADIFGWSFFLISRYEEYLPFTPDEYGRFPHTRSLSFKMGWLQVPIVDLWIEKLRTYLKTNFPASSFPPKKFSYTPTYDVDIAWSYRNKGFVRNVGGLLQQLVQGKFKEARQRLQVVSGKEKDPFYSYDWLDELHREKLISPIYFFITAPKRGKYDKNISPHNPEMKQLIREHNEKYDIGLHPSWYSGDVKEYLSKEKSLLEKIAGRQITKSRQHFIRLILPETYNRLIDAGITDDYSMGYGSINGFRAGTSTSFYWYDLVQEKQTSLRVHPFCFMDANSFFEQHFTPSEAIEELRHYYNIVRDVNGELVTIWHHPFFGTDTLFNGWKEVYKKWFSEITFSGTPGSQDIHRT